jgi:hypothetical protein
MSADQLKQLVQSVLSKKSPAGALRPHVVELIQLAATDREVREALDELDDLNEDDVASVLRALGATEEPSVNEGIDERAASDVRGAIEELCSVAPTAEQVLARGLDPLLLDGAIEGASNIFRHLTRGSDKVWWLWTGDVVLGENEVKPRAEFEEELARYLSLWTDDDRPAPEVVHLWSWLRRVVVRVGELFRHVEVVSMAGFFVALRPRPRDQWSRSRVERWTAAPRVSGTYQLQEHYFTTRLGRSLIRVNACGPISKGEITSAASQAWGASLSLNEVNTFSAPRPNDSLKLIHTSDLAVAVGWVEGKASSGAPSGP